LPRLESLAEALTFAESGVDPGLLLEFLTTTMFTRVQGLWRCSSTKHERQDFFATGLKDVRLVLQAAEWRAVPIASTADRFVTAMARAESGWPRGCGTTAGKNWRSRRPDG
jgi:3-hydroxyisobutyrate dehydrogenase-like beta-hydroxyacid dehydrogenase